MADYDGMTIKPGDPVRAFTATQEWLTLRAASPVVSGQDFPIVWVCDDAAWNSADGEVPSSALPWPAESVEQIGDKR